MQYVIFEAEKKNLIYDLFEERQVLREKLSDLLSEKVRQIIEIMDKHDYTPHFQNHCQLDTMYETEFKDIQPYLFRVSNEPFSFFYCLLKFQFQIKKLYYSLDGAINQQSVGTTMKRMIKDALSFS